MAGPQKQFDCDQALERALETFWEKGYEATSMGDLVNNMGINRASLYDTFGNKEMLFNRALDWYGEASMQAIHHILCTPGSPLTAVENFIKLPLQSPKRSRRFGCFLNNSAVELGPHNTVVAKKIRRFWQRLENEIKIALERAVSAGEIRQDTDTDSMAKLCNTMMQGVVVKLKAGADSRELQQLIDLFIQNLKC